MAMTQAERQQGFRDRQRANANTTLVSAWLARDAVERLKTLARINGRTIKGQLENLIREAKA